MGLVKKGKQLTRRKLCSFLLNLKSKFDYLILPQILGNCQPKKVRPNKS
jgi:hypothetical protein